MIPGVDRDSRPWWEALARHEHVHQRCSSCSRWRWPARAMCGACGSFEWSWEPVSGRGTVVSHIRTHHSFLPGIEAPYSTVFVSLEEQADLVLVGFWSGDGEPTTGQPVEHVYVDQEDGDTLLGWQ